MCRSLPTQCALRDDHAGPHLTAQQLNELVQSNMDELEHDIDKALGQQT